MQTIPRKIKQQVKSDSTLSGNNDKKRDEIGRTQEINLAAKTDVDIKCTHINTVVIKAPSLTEQDDLTLHSHFFLSFPRFPFFMNFFRRGVRVKSDR